MKKILKFAVIFVLSLAIVITADAQEVTNNILNRVFLIKFRGDFGASFTIEVQDRQYLITAKHTVNNIKEGDKIEIMHDGKWELLPVKPLYIQPPEVDIVVLILPKQISPTMPIEPSSVGLFLSQKMYFLGFPFGLRMEYDGLNMRFPLPIVKSGICSAFIQPQPNTGYQIILVDGVNNPGFSGGPLVYVEQKSKQLKIAGVIKGYRHQEEKVFRKVLRENKKSNDDYQLEETDMVIKSNTGIVIAYDIGSAVGVIKNNPIGPVVKK